jgi:hypothetical protein
VVQCRVKLDSAHLCTGSKVRSNRHFILPCFVRLLLSSWHLTASEIRKQILSGELIWTRLLEFTIIFGMLRVNELKEKESMEERRPDKKNACSELLYHMLLYSAKGVPLRFKRLKPMLCTLRVR